MSDAKTTMLDAIRQLCATFSAAGIAQPSSMMMQSEADFERLAHELAKEAGKPEWLVTLPTKPEHTGVIQFHGILFLNSRVWTESRK